MNARCRLLAVTALLALPAAAAADYLRVGNWNVANRPNTAAQADDFAAVAGYVATLSGPTSTGRPFDVLAVAVTGTGSTPELVARLNAIAGFGTYAAYESPADAGGDRTALIYNTASVELVEVATVDGASLTHPATRSRCRPAGAGTGISDFWVYGLHLTSGDGLADALDRAAEAAVLRADADALGSAAIIYAGDFSWLGIDEAGAAASTWDVFTAAGKGSAFDPAGAGGDWRDNPAFLDLHTQDPGGSMDDCFDLQLLTDELADGVGLD